MGFPVSKGKALEYGRWKTSILGIERNVVKWMENDAEEKIGLSAFADRLGGLSISDLLLDGAWQNGAIDWDKRLESQRKDCR